MEGARHDRGSKSKSVGGRVEDHALQKLGDDVSLEVQPRSSMKGMAASTTKNKGVAKTRPGGGLRRPLRLNLLFHPKKAWPNLTRLLPLTASKKQASRFRAVGTSYHRFFWDSMARKAYVESRCQRL